MWYALAMGSSDGLSVMVVTNSGNSAASSLVSDVNSLIKIASREGIKWIKNI